MSVWQLTARRPWKNKRRGGREEGGVRGTGSLPRWEVPCLVAPAGRGVAPNRGGSLPRGPAGRGVAPIMGGSLPRGPAGRGVAPIRGGSLPRGPAGRGVAPIRGGSLPRGPAGRGARGHARRVDSLDWRGTTSEERHVIGYILGAFMCGIGFNDQRNPARTPLPVWGDSPSRGATRQGASPNRGDSPSRGEAGRLP